MLVSGWHDNKWDLLLVCTQQVVGHRLGMTAQPDNAGVLLLPATVYDHKPSVVDAKFRVGFGRRNMPDCLRVLDNFLQKDRQRSLA